MSYRLIMGALRDLTIHDGPRNTVVNSLPAIARRVRVTYPLSDLGQDVLAEQVAGALGSIHANYSDPDGDGFFVGRERLVTSKLLCTPSDGNEVGGTRMPDLADLREDSFTQAVAQIAHGDWPSASDGGMPASPDCHWTNIGVGAGSDREERALTSLQDPVCRRRKVHSPPRHHLALVASALGAHGAYISIARTDTRTRSPSSIPSAVRTAFFTGST